MYRQTFLEVNLLSIRDNVISIRKKQPDYSYYFGIVKANCYGLGLECVSSLVAGGCNYLCVATLEEGIQVREMYPSIPILCLEIIDLAYLGIAYQNQITITVSSFAYAEAIVSSHLPVHAIHLKVNTGMNRLGFSKVSSFLETYTLLTDNAYFVEGVYTHFYQPEDEAIYHKQLALFRDYALQVEVPIVHLGGSVAGYLYDKPDFVNGYRLGILQYGIGVDSLSSCVSLRSYVMFLEDDITGTVGYNGRYTLHTGDRIAVVPIGYADGIDRKSTGFSFQIHEKRFPIVGNVCMDMLFLLVDGSVNEGDSVDLICSNSDLEAYATYLDTIPYEVLCRISSRVPRVYVGEL